MCLCLTSRYFWTFAREFIRNYHRSYLGRWAGENIVCVGEGAEPGDFPPGLFSVEEANDLFQGTIDVSNNSHGPDDRAHPQVPLTLHHFTLPNVSHIDEKAAGLEVESLNIFYECVSRSRHSDPKFRLPAGYYAFPEFRMARSEICITDSTYLPHDELWILRNLTTKEFVRSEAIALRRDFIRGPNIDNLGFGEVIASRICWSTPSSARTGDMADLYRGVWAGHRFDIVTISKHRDETKEEDWRDVSDEVARETAGIWESEYGPDWRRIIASPYSPDMAAESADTLVEGFTDDAQDFRI